MEPTSEHAPSPADVCAAVCRWLDHYWDVKREKAKWTDIAMVVLTLLVAVAAFVSALIFQGQLSESRKATVAATQNFMLDERAWVEIEPIKPVLIANSSPDRAMFFCNIYPKNVGKTAATDIVVRALSLTSSEAFGNSDEQIRNTQDKMLLNKFTEMGTEQPVVVPDNPVSKVLGPGATAAAPFRLGCSEPATFKSGFQMREYIVGRIDYSDQFRIKHWLKFCYFVVNRRGEIWNCQAGNDEDHNPEIPPEAKSFVNSDSWNGGKRMSSLQRVLLFLDEHSGLISAVGLVLAGIGLLLTLQYLKMYQGEVKKQRVEQERLAWERILKLLHQVAVYAAEANLSSVTHSRLTKKLGFLPPEVAARYGQASETLLIYWHQLRVELELMPSTDLVERIQQFILRYDAADDRASEQFANDLYPITHEAVERAQRSF
jgi:hypothetical protein